MSRRRIQKSQRRGAATVEFACVLPVFLLIVLGMFELGRGIIALTSMTNAAREGARHAALRSSTSTSTKELVSSTLRSAGLSGEQISFSAEPSNVKSGEPISVTVTVPYSSVSWLTSSRYFAGKSLTSTVVMQKE